jgi:radical SAM superfamily enzyme YgiQ (UPF0313 family)/glycosyltransferase involved in cell wall biosynthesis
MNYLVVLIATRWGSELGGINVFNTGLAEGIAEVLHTEGTCACFVEELPSEAVRSASNVNLFSYADGSRDIVDTIEGSLLSPTGEGPKEILIVGHDIKTGQIAIDLARLLADKRKIRCRSAVVSHMDYVQYGSYKGSSTDVVASRAIEQRDVVAKADLAFAVGPLLQSSFQQARCDNTSRVEMLIPGAPAVILQQEDETDALRFFISGRLGSEDDRIKNGQLTIQSLIKAYKIARAPKTQSKWTIRGTLIAFGVDQEKDKEALKNLNNGAQGLFTIEPIPFSGDHSQVLRKLERSHVAFMPSWHEGFGLTGWEALCAGVPLICSKQSGLAKLLIHLKQEELSDISLESVVFVDLAGVTEKGQISARDIRALNDALFTTIADYHTRKQAALRLAKRLCEEFTWKRCANGLLSNVGWAFPQSVEWQARQKVGDHHRELEDDKLVEDALKLASEGQALKEWEFICSALNIFSNRGKSFDIKVKGHLFRQLEELSKNLDASLGSLDQRDAETPIRDSGRLDVCWRFLASASSVASSFGQFSQLIGANLFKQVCSDSFLRREFLFYSCRFAGEFSGRSKNVAKARLSPLIDYLDYDPSFQRRLARLATIHPELLEVLEPRENHIQYHVEYEACHTLEAAPWSVTDKVVQYPSLGPSLLALSSLRKDRRRLSIDHVLNFFEEYQEQQVKLQWRGDKRLKAGLLTASLDPQTVLKVLKCMVEDEEESVRWAAVDLIFSKVLRERLVETAASKGFGSTVPSLLGKLGALVDKALTFDGCHPWIQREFLKLYLREYESPPKMAKENRFTLNDFPIARTLLGPGLSAEQSLQLKHFHPEVLDLKNKAKDTIKRILLVLPPIDMSNRTSATEASSTTTPPLGLGILASHLSALGHDVYLADCHRYPSLCKHVESIAQYFDLVGFNVVLSTVQSTYHLASKIRRLSTRTRPVIVVGGPAVNLHAWPFSGCTDEESKCWDFEIRSNAEQNLEALVSTLDSELSWPSLVGVDVNFQSEIIAFRGVSERTHETHAVGEVDRLWEPRQRLDRRVFTGPYGRYEPSHTRAISDNFNEAHVVMSRGCDWNCAFCTERRTLSGGERRRSPESVDSELRELAATHKNLRIQFVDDNLFPQIAVPDNTSGVKRAMAIEWSTKFLNNMTALKKQSDSALGWRGIFRIEDFLEYEKELSSGSFISKLKDSGCRMLAFGVEHGNEHRRQIEKASDAVSNQDIIDLFRRLSSAGVHTKAYFILGGQKESVETSQETIRFALDSGATLAYFALFKDFVTAVSILKRESAPGADKHASYLSYKQLWPTWDAILSSVSVSATACDAQQIFSETLCVPSMKPEQANDALKSYQQLAQMGFKFSDLVKYNDYHSNEGPAAQVLHNVALGNVETYFSLVNMAYIRFYLRTEFVDAYKKLIADGY